MSKYLNLEIIGKGRPLIMLHGWGSHSGIWQPLVSQLSADFQLFLIDLPGFGKSPLLSKDYEIEEISAALLEMTPPESAWLGWSLGGMIAWYIALHYPTHVSHLVTVASSPKFVESHDWPGVSSATLENFSQRLMQDYKNTWQDFLELQLRGTPKSPELNDLLQKQMIEASPDLVAALSSSLELLHTLDLRAELIRMRIPSLHIFGNNDRLVPINVIEKIQPLLMHGKCKVIKRCGHIPFLSQTEIFLQEIKNFLR